MRSSFSAKKCGAPSRSSPCSPRLERLTCFARTKFRERERCLDLFELVAGYRMHTRYFQTGGLAEDIPPGFFPEARKFVESMPRKRVGSPEFLDPVLLMLCASESHFVNGAVVSADDGFSL